MCGYCGAENYQLVIFQRPIGLDQNSNVWLLSLVQVLQLSLL